MGYSLPHSWKTLYEGDVAPQGNIFIIGGKKYIPLNWDHIFNLDTKQTYIEITVREK